MKQGLVLSDEQCSKRFGPRKGEREKMYSEGTSINKVEESNLKKMEENLYNPSNRVEHEAAIDSEYAALIDSDKSFEDYNRMGRKMIVSLFRLDPKDTIFS